MFDKSAMAQLQSLKKEIHDNTPRFQGRVRSTQGRFGFVDNDQGSSYFLSPDEMEKVLAGDLISYRVEEQGDGKQQAFVESLDETATNTFIGRYTIRGKGHFIAPDDPMVDRWMFIPPKLRNKASDGDFVRARLSQHPYKSGKPQAEILEIIGQLGSPGFERKVIETKFDFTSEIPAEIIEAAEQICQSDQESLLENRTDLTHLAFVTIDSAGTRDIDDALYAEAQSDGWNLWVAIADPAAVVTPGSQLDQFAKQRATSTYYPDAVVPMLPAQISEQLCSLQQGVVRPAMVVELRIGENGDVRHTAIHSAKICSQAKLSYHQVAALIAGSDNDIAAELQGPLLHLWDCAKSLNEYRKKQCLLIDERPDYKLVLNEELQVDEIIKLERNDAHRLVEECMLACNRSIADWLTEKNSGFFITNGGVRTERLGDVMSLIKETLELASKPKLHELESYIDVMQQVADYQGDIKLRDIIARQQDRSLYSLTSAPHMGLGFRCYTTFTSPLRKYNDLEIHRIVKQCLSTDDEPINLPTAEALKSIQEQQLKSRQAANQVEYWMKLQWLKKQSIDAVQEVSIVHIGGQGMTCRFEDSGIEGHIECRKSKKGNKPQWQFDSQNMTQTLGQQVYSIGQLIKVNICELNLEDRSLKLSLADG